MKYIRYYPWGQPQPPRNEKLLNILKCIEIPPLNHIYSCSLCHMQDMQYISYGPWGQPHLPEMGNC
jgi:hypothetical protein